MPGKVVDAPVITASVIGEPRAEQVLAKLSGAALVAPALLSFELANIAVKTLRRHPDQRAALRRGVRAARGGAAGGKLCVISLPADPAHNELL